MTGTGTSADPYIPDNWGELVSCAKTSGASYISLPEGGEWDMNEQYPTGAPTLEMHGCHIDGNGFIIKNLYNTDTMIRAYGMGDTSYMKNLIFQNVYSNGKYLIDYQNNYYGRIKMENVSISGVVINSSIIQYMDSYQSLFDRCTFNLKLHNAGARMLRQKFNFCNINLVGSVNDNFVAILGNSQLVGDLSGSGSQTFTIEAESSLSKIDMAIKGFSSVACSSGVNVVINTDKVDSGITVSDNLIKATTEQMADAEWLNGHGFPCGEAS